MEERFRKTEGSQPLYKAYSIIENSNQSYDDRVDLNEGPGTRGRHNSMHNTGFTTYGHSGGISKNDGERHKYNSIALKISEAK